MSGQCCNDIKIYVIPGEDPITIHMIKPSVPSFKAIIRTHSNYDFFDMIKRAPFRLAKKIPSRRVAEIVKELEKVTVTEMPGHMYRIDGLDEEKEWTFGELCELLSDEYNCSYPWLVLRDEILDEPN